MNDQPIFKERLHTDSMKWDNLLQNFGKEGLQAMWVADMDFAVPSCVQEALNAYVAHGVFGYYKVPDGYYDAFIHWEKTYHGYEVKREWLRFAPGVVPAINWWIQILTASGDGVIVLTPVYYPFLNAIKNNGRRLIQCDLINEGGRYSIDFHGFEEKIKSENVKLFILSSPHNPVGRVWSSQELQRLMEICERHGVYVLSDEIHQDLTFGGAKHHPTAGLGDYERFLITLTAVTKTFNLAACQNSFVIIPDAALRETFDRYVESIRITGGNTFGYVAVKAALEKGRPWFEQIKEIISGNENYIRTVFSQRLPLVQISPLEGTYLLWLNFSSYLQPEEVKDFMEQTCGLAFDYGDWFGGSRFRPYVRMNLATSREKVEHAAESIIKNLQSRI